MFGYDQIDWKIGVSFKRGFNFIWSDELDWSLTFQTIFNIYIIYLYASNEKLSVE